MNNRQKLHKLKLIHRDARFQEQAAGGLSVRNWCAENNVTIHTYNYWKHQLKLEYMDSLLPAEHDIVALTLDLLRLSVPLQPQPDTTPLVRFTPYGCSLHQRIPNPYFIRIW